MQLHTHPAQPASITSKSCGSLGPVIAFFPVVCQGHVKYPQEWVVGLASSSAVFSLFFLFCLLGKAEYFPSLPVVKILLPSKILLITCMCMCEHVSVIGASDPLGARTQTLVLGWMVHTASPKPSLQLQLSLTQQWGWLVTWVYWLCLWKDLREKRLSFSKSGMYDCTRAARCMLPGRQILPLENQLLFSILCPAPHILLGCLTLGRFATLPGFLQADLCSVLVLGIKYWQFFFSFKSLPWVFLIPTFKLINKSVWVGATSMVSQTVVLSLNVKSPVFLSVSLEFCTFGPLF